MRNTTAVKLTNRNFLDIITGDKSHNFYCFNFNWFTESQIQFQNFDRNTSQSKFVFYYWWKEWVIKRGTYEMKTCMHIVNSQNAFNNVPLMLKIKTLTYYRPPQNGRLYDMKIDRIHPRSYYEHVSFVQTVLKIK